MSSTANPLVLVTGVSGYLGSHVVETLLQQSYRVRGTVRSAKIATVQAAYSAYGDRVEIVGVDDLISGDFTQALEGASAIIHVASPLFGRTDHKSTVDTAVEGTVNVIRQAQKAGIKHISVISSAVSLFDVTNPRPPFTEKDWNPATYEQALDGTRNDFFVYSASKALAERAVWKIADEHPDLNITTVLPPYFMGPLASSFQARPGDVNALSTSIYIYRLLLPQSKISTPRPGFVDVRDVAKALVAGIKAPGRNRALIMSDWFDYQDALEHIAAVRPELKDRLTSVSRIGQTEGWMNSARAIETLGLPPVTPWKQTVIDSIDSLLKLEREWEAQGVDLDTVFKQVLA